MKICTIYLSKKCTIYFTMKRHIYRKNFYKLNLEYIFHSMTYQILSKVSKPVSYLKLKHLYMLGSNPLPPPAASKNVVLKLRSVMIIVSAMYLQ